VNPPAPKAPRDLMLAPICVEIDGNLERIRDKQPTDIDVQLQLELDRPPIPDTREQRGAHVLHAALRNVELHHWTAEITPDACRLRLSGGVGHPRPWAERDDHAIHRRRRAVGR